ncbi:MAG: FGGY family carbohydrate kinase [Clostridiaceae bacterium]
MYFIGLDMGTQGVRGIVTNYKGELICESNIKFDVINCSNIEGFIEQDSSMWLNSTIDVLKDLVYKFKNMGRRVEDIKALSLDGTSGTIVFLDKDNKPLSNGIMYNDRRAYEESHIVQSYGKELSESLGYKFNFSYALPKILWVRNHRPDIYEKTKKILHQGDYILGNL